MIRPLRTILGPRVPAQELHEHGWRYAAPTLVLSIARVALLVSIFLPYWRMDLQAPQYPQGLQVQTYVNRVTGDVREIDSLNHYIGMRPLDEAAQLERSLAVFAIIALVLLVEGVAYVHSKWASLLALPAILYPAIFLLDLRYWLHDFGTNLDPSAAMSNAIEPFSPPVLGVGVIGQFQTHARMGPGLLLAVTASVLIVLALWLHRRAYKPLVESTADGAPEGAAA